MEREIRKSDAAFIGWSQIALRAIMCPVKIQIDYKWGTTENPLVLHGIGFYVCVYIGHCI